VLLKDLDIEFQTSCKDFFKQTLESLQSIEDGRSRTFKNSDSLLNFIKEYIKAFDSNECLPNLNSIALVFKIYFNIVSFFIMSL
jgi:hypothetical protein